MRIQATTPKRRWWGASELALVRERYPHTPTVELARQLGRSLTTVYQCAQKLGLHKSAEYLASPAACRTNGRQGMGTRFPKGNVPHNKGLRRPGWGPGRMKETQFKKGNVSKRWDPDIYPVGALRPDANQEGRRHPLHRGRAA